MSNKKPKTPPDLFVIKVEDLPDKKTTIFCVVGADDLKADDLGPVMPVLLSAGAIDSLIESGRVIDSAIGPITNVVGDNLEESLTALADHLGIAEVEAHKFAPLYSSSIAAKTGPLGDTEVLQVAITPAKTAEDRVRGDVSGAPTLVLSLDDKVVGALVTDGEDLSLILGESTETGCLRVQRFVDDKATILLLLKTHVVYPDELPDVQIAMGGKGASTIPVARLVATEDGKNAFRPATGTLLVHSQTFEDAAIAEVHDVSQGVVNEIASKGSGGVYRIGDPSLSTGDVPDICISVLPDLYNGVDVLDAASRPGELPHQNAAPPPSTSSIHGQRVFIGIGMEHAQVRSDAITSIRLMGGHLVISPDNADVVVVSENAPVDRTSKWPNKVIALESLSPF